jgi:hypothetical protein
VISLAATTGLIGAITMGGGDPDQVQTEYQVFA